MINSDDIETYSKRLNYFHRLLIAKWSFCEYSISIPSPDEYIFDHLENMNNIFNQMISNLSSELDQMWDKISKG